MHNPMFVSQVAQSAWHAWMLCRLLMADLRAARQAPRTNEQCTSEQFTNAAAPDEAAALAGCDSFDERL